MAIKNDRIFIFDYLRFIFAFLVVVIHVENIGRWYLLPLARCAVPFFYMLTGFFLYTTEECFISNVKKSLKKYGKYFILYFVLQTILIVLLKLYCDNQIIIDKKDIIKLFFIEGSSNFSNIINIHGITYGFSALWYLYGGFISLIIFYLFPQIQKSNIFLFCSILINYLYVSINHGNEPILPSIICIPLVYLYWGIFIKKCWLKELPISARLVLPLLCISIFITYYEVICLGNQHYFIYSLLPSSLLLFCFFLCIEKKRYKVFSHNISTLNHISLFIFIWHRPIYVILVGLFELNFLHIDAIFVYIISFLLGFMLTFFKNKRTLC